MKLRTELMLIAIGIVIFAVSISTFLVITFTKQNAIDEITDSGTADFEDFYRSLSASVLNEHLNVTDNSLYSYMRYIFYKIPGRNEFILQQGDSIISNNTGIDAVKALDAHMTSVTKINAFREITLRKTICQISGRDYFIASAEIVFYEQAYILSFVRDVTSKMDDIGSLGMKCAFAGTVVIIAAAASVLLFVHRSLLPLRELEKGAVQISDGNYESRIEIKGHNEIASVAERFNRMAEAVDEKIAELNETAENQQTFINALSHEMKTPVTSIMARAETLLLRDVSESDIKRSLERIYNQCAWMEKLSTKLTALVLLQGRIDVKQESVEKLFAVIKETVSDTLDQKNIRLVLTCKMDTLLIDFDLICAAIVNLIDNSRKASDYGSSIELSVYDNIIEVKDYGKGIPKEEIDHITQPFYMIDRSRSKKSGGNGLGLALVERIVLAHNAKLTISSVIGKETIFRIILPDDIY